MPHDACKPFTDNPLLQRMAAPAAIALACFAAACSSIPQPTEQVDAARAAVSQAQPVATQDGAAELQVARAKLALAEDAIQQGDYVNARVFAEQAEVDARYAWILAETARMQRAAATRRPQ
jgi:Domain of unknown function (DUF4398)